jgi:hypothetical protein
MVVSIPVGGEVLRVLGSPIKIDGHTPDYAAPPLLDEHGETVDPGGVA